MPFKFPARRHFGFMTCFGCRYRLEIEDLLCETIGQPLHVIKFKTGKRGAGNFKAIMFFFMYYYF